VEESITANGDITYDQNYVTPLATPVAGRLYRVQTEVGEAVKPGDVLALVDAAAVGKAKHDFLHALAVVNLKDRTLKAMKPAYRNGAIPEARFRESQAALNQAQIRLVAARQVLGNLGLPIPAEDVQQLSPDKLGERLQFLGLEALTEKLKAEKTATANLLPIKAPRAGVVVVRQAAVGEVVDSSKTLFIVADPQRMWLTLHVRQDSLKPFRQSNPRLLLQGKTVHFQPDGAREFQPDGARAESHGAD